MRFLHTADWHLGRIFHGVHLTDDQAYVLEQLQQLVREVKPDAVVIAGDVYDRSVPPTEAVRLLDDTLSRLLLDYKIPVIMIAGNHDSPDRLGFGNRLLSGQGLFVTGQLPAKLEPVVLYDSYGPVYFLPLTYAEPAVVRNIWQLEADGHEAALKAMIEHVTASIPPAVRKVALAHAFVAGSLESESERPLSVGGSSAVGSALFAGFNYTALGHLHNSQQAGSEKIRYSGSLLKYSFAEADQKKGINLVELNGDGSVAVTVFSLAPRHEVRCLRGLFRDIMAQAQTDSAKEDYLMITLEDHQPILDARLRLKEIYPNLLDFDYLRLNRSGTLQGPASDHRRLNEASLFASFFNQMTGEDLTAEQEQTFRDLLDELNRDEREAAL